MIDAQAVRCQRCPCLGDVFAMGWLTVPTTQVPGNTPRWSVSDGKSTAATKTSGWTNRFKSHYLRPGSFLWSRRKRVILWDVICGYWNRYWQIDRVVLYSKKSTVNVLFRIICWCSDSFSLIDSNVKYVKSILILNVNSLKSEDSSGRGWVICKGKAADSLSAQANLKPRLDRRRRCLCAWSRAQSRSWTANWNGNSADLAEVVFDFVWAPGKAKQFAFGKKRWHVQTCLKFWVVRSYISCWMQTIAEDQTLSVVHVYNSLAQH